MKKLLLRIREADQAFERQERQWIPLLALWASAVFFIYNLAKLVGSLQ